MRIDPSRLCWTFGNHEPIPMYRRIGGKSTGGVSGGARWLEDWHHWYDSEKCADTMASLGFNILHCRFYKGLGWKAEEADFENVRGFARACRARGIKVLGYVQFSSVYPEVMRREIPNLADWAARACDGSIQRYMSSYWRWIPCANHPEFIAYLDDILRKMIESGEFDGVMFDNLVNFHCYCDTCRKKFIERLKQRNFDFLDPEFVELPPPFALEQPEIADPVAQEFMRFRHDSLNAVFSHFRKLIKELNPGFIISANLTATARRRNYTTYGMNVLRAGRQLDIVLSQSGNEPEAAGRNRVVSQIHELKMTRAIGRLVQPLNDADGGGRVDAGSRYVAGLFEVLFGGAIPVDRVAMKPLRGGEFNAAAAAIRQPVLMRMHALADRYNRLLKEPDFEPVGLLWSEDSVMFSQASFESFLRVEESLLRGQVPFRIVTATGDGVDAAALEDCDTLIVPDARCLSDRSVRQLLDYPGRLVLAGTSCGDFDENYCERAASPWGQHGEHLSISPHEILESDWRVLLRFVPDDWGRRFATDVALELDPIAHAVIKRRSDGKIAGILATAPAVTAPWRVTLPEKIRCGNYSLVTLGGETPVEFNGDRLELPAIDGMAMLVSKEY